MAVRSAKQLPRSLTYSGLNQAHREQVAKLGNPYRDRVTLFVESHGTSDHERYQDATWSDEDTVTTGGPYCMTCGERLGTRTNGPDGAGNRDEADSYDWNRSREMYDSGYDPTP